MPSDEQPLSHLNDGYVNHDPFRQQEIMLRKSGLIAANAKVAIPVIGLSLRHPPSVYATDHCAQFSCIL